MLQEICKVKNKEPLHWNKSSSAWIWPCALSFVYHCRRTHWHNLGFMCHITWAEITGFLLCAAADGAGEALRSPLLHTCPKKLFPPFTYFVCFVYEGIYAIQNNTQVEYFFFLSCYPRVKLEIPVLLLCCVFISCYKISSFLIASKTDVLFFQDNPPLLFFRPQMQWTPFKFIFYKLSRCIGPVDRMCVLQLLPLPKKFL